ncbi:hypothetical protein VTH06DRAFT_7953 [Thermothelomyces fergusii]
MARTTRSSARQEYRPESSWRVVEGGENDSFDTSILHDDEDFTVSGGAGAGGSQATASQPFSIGGSQPWSVGGSQDDSIENFLSRAEEDEQVLLRSPFRPSVPKEVRDGSREHLRHREPEPEPEPEPEFYMPRVDVENPRTASTWSSSTVRPAAPPSSPPELRQRRQGRAAGGGGSEKERRAREGAHASSAPGGAEASTTLLAAVVGSLNWALGVLGLALGYAKKPLAVLLSLYITFGGVIVLQNMATKSLYTSLSPICRIPGASWMGLPFCPELEPARENDGGRKQPVEFDKLMDVQGQFERVAEMTAERVSLPMEMKRSEASIRDLRAVVRHSNLVNKEELMLEFDGFIDRSQVAISVLHRFNTRVTSTVDWLIMMNRWMARHLEPFDLPDDHGGDGGLVGSWVSWLFSPFQPTVLSERYLVDRYVEHTALVSDKMAALILEARSILHTLARAEEHLDNMYSFVVRTQQAVQSRRDDILWTLWTLVGANRRRLGSLDAQLALLRQVDAQRSDAVRQVSELVDELERIQAGLGDLRERVGLVADRDALPLSVHIDSINRGVERLEAARARIQAVEEARMREVLARGGRPDEKLIDAS